YSSSSSSFIIRLPVTAQSVGFALGSRACLSPCHHSTAVWGFVYDSRSNLQMRGLVVLLLSKAAGPSSSSGQAAAHPQAQDMVVELIASAIGDLVQGVYNENSPNLEDSNPGDILDMDVWEEQTFLSHGALLAKSCQAAMELAKHELESQRLAYKYGKHLSLGHQAKQHSDQRTCVFFTKRKNAEEPDSNPGDILDMDVWEEQTFLSHGALLAKSCQAAMELAKHEPESQRLAYKYGKHLSLGHQASQTHLSTFHLDTRQLHADLQPFVKSGAGELAAFSLNSGPVVFHRQIVGQDKWRQQLEEKGLRGFMIPESQDKTPAARACPSYTAGVQQESLWAAIKSERGVSSAVDLCRYHGNKALAAIQAFPPSEARSALENIAGAVTKF
ncbi:hypothetical protein CRUP_019699, partial [Coryphaenoides rupestris]